MARKTVPTSIRKAVADRDGGRCRFCGTPVAVEAHHILYRSQGGSDAEDNLISLCVTHHALVHSDKRRYQPILLMALEFGRRGIQLSVPQTERWLGKEKRDGTETAL